MPPDSSFDPSALGRSLAIAVAIAAGAALEALAGAALIRRAVDKHTSLEDEVDIRRFALLGGPVAGIGVFLAQKLLNDPLGQLIAYDYSVTGTWSDPTVSKIAFERSSPG